MYVKGVKLVDFAVFDSFSGSFYMSKVPNLRHFEAVLSSITLYLPYVKF